MTKVYLVKCCFADETEKVIGPYEMKEVAHYVADAVETHFYDGGDQYTEVEERTVIE